MATTKHTTRPLRAIDADTVRTENRIIEHALSILESRALTPGELLSNFDTAANWFRLKLAESPREIFAVAWLNRDHRLLAFQELFFGTLERAEVHLREVIRFALHFNASACLFAHNHPSGNPRPSRDDIELTSLLVVALHHIKVQVLDHFVVTAAEPPFSMAKHGMVMMGLMGMDDDDYPKPPR